jgi:hypothetical protein
MSKENDIAVELKKISEEAHRKRKAQEREKRKEIREKNKKIREAVEKRVNEIIALIPVKLKEAAANIEKKNGKLEVVAEIFIVREEMCSIMSTRGYLDNFDEKVLKAIRKRIKMLKIEGVKLSEAHRTRTMTFMSVDCTESSPGPCTFYYIKAESVIEC